MTTNKLRSPIAVFFLALITGGIYYFYWLYKINEEAAVISRDESANPGLSLLAATVGMLLIVPFFWTHWTSAQRVGNAVGKPPSTGALVVFAILLSPFGLPYTIWLQGMLNQYGRRAMMAAPAS